MKTQRFFKNLLLHHKHSNNPLFAEGSYELCALTIPERKLDLDYLLELLAEDHEPEVKDLAIRLLRKIKSKRLKIRNMLQSLIDYGELDSNSFIRLLAHKAPISGSTLRILRHYLPKVKRVASRKMIEQMIRKAIGIKMDKKLGRTTYPLTKIGIENVLKMYDPKNDLEAEVIFDFYQEASLCFDLEFSFECLFNPELKRARGLISDVILLNASEFQINIPLILELIKKNQNRLEASPSLFAAFVLAWNAIQEIIWVVSPVQSDFETLLRFFESKENLEPERRLVGQFLLAHFRDVLSKDTVESIKILAKRSCTEKTCLGFKKENKIIEFFQNLPRT